MYCNICYEKFDLNSHKPVIIMMCAHTFCSKCLHKLTKDSELCPVCKGEIISMKPNYSIIEFLEEKQKVSIKLIHKLFLIYSNINLL